MRKISVLFKPSNKSGISGDLQLLGYYEYHYKDIYDIDLTYTSKAKIYNVPYEDIGELYEYLKKFEGVFIIMSRITGLFE